MGQLHRLYGVSLAMACVTLELLSGCSKSSSETSNSPPVADGPLTATLSVSATDPDGDALTTEWAVTSGTMAAGPNGTVKWTLPTGGGTHFAYVTVSDGKGAFVERSLALSLGEASATPSTPNPRNNLFTVPLSGVPASAASLKGTFSVDRQFGAPAQTRRIYLPGETLVLTAGFGSPYAGSLIVNVSDETGSFSAPYLAAGQYTASCGTFASADCFGDSLFVAAPVGSANPAATVQLEGLAHWMLSIRPIDSGATPPAPGDYLLHGHVSLADGSVCGLRSAYKGIFKGATAEYGNSQVQVNKYGDYAIRLSEAPISGTSVTFRCEGSVLSVPVGATGSTTEVSGKFSNRPPVVSQLTAVANGLTVGKAIADVEGTASSGFPRTDHFLTYKGADTRQSACIYYLRIGATPSCGPYGELPGNAITFDEWKRIRRLAPYDSASNREVRATYINQVDLNLVRDMHAIKHSGTDYAFYVCNYPAPDAAVPSADQISSGVSNARTGKGLVACVAMDFSVTPGENGDRPFTKFYVFGPGGSLISSVNLDGRGEKFVPGACVVCHGGEQYAGKFPQITFPIESQDTPPRPSAQLGARFLPFDLANYAFSTSSGLRDTDQYASFKQLNSMVHDIENFIQPNSPASQLIAGWYGASPGLTTNIVPNLNYLPQYWANQTDPVARDFYRLVVAKACRTCHVALPRSNWDAVAPPHEGNAGSTQRRRVCGGGIDIQNNAVMPNSKVTFDRMWASANQATDDGGKMRAALVKYLNCDVSVNRSGLMAPLPDPGFPSR